VADKTGGEVPAWREPIVQSEPSAVEDVVQPRRKVRTGPLQLRPQDDLDDRPGLESRLPLLILLGLGLLIVVQVVLAL